MRDEPLLSHCVIGGEPGWVVIARTRHEDIHVGSGRDVLSLTVLAITTHPGSGHADGTTGEMLCMHNRSQWGVVTNTTVKKVNGFSH